MTTTGFSVAQLTAVQPSATGLPLGVSFVNNGDGTAKLTVGPTVAKGTYTQVITASNGWLPAAAQLFKLTIA